LFSLISKRAFVETWPRIRTYWLKLERDSDFRDWWQTIYEQLLEGYGIKQKIHKGKSFTLSLKIGKLIKEARISKGLSQNGLALLIKMKQPDISMIEEGRKNITLETLARLCRALDIKKIDLL
jgi:ribosome-binding protein aMBF1 (putative translation factor)